MIEEALCTFLNESVGVTAIVEDRIFDTYLPQEPETELPALTFQMIDTVEEMHLSGTSGLVRSRFQLNLWASSTRAMRTLRTAVRNRLQGYSGAMGAVTVQMAAIDSFSSIFEDSASADTQRMFGCQMDIFIWTILAQPDFS